jgi:phenylpropionate dioxygenase-like ring-hydroxylating dioxygenase large terminal subunit
MARYPFPAVPDGWFCVAASDSLAQGEVKAVHYLDRELVVFRAEDSKARVFDAYCPHLGAHLGVGGTVCGTGLRCPFHAWRFDGDGRLAAVPDLDVPPRVSPESFEVRELNGRVFVWQHAQGSAPAYDVLPYRDDESAWTPWRSSSYTVRVHVQDLTENIIDRAHFPAVHDMAPPEDKRFEVRFDGPSMVVEQNVKVTAVAASGFEVSTRTTTCGPGIVAVEVEQDELQMLTYITQTPVDSELTEIGIHFSMKALPDAAATEAISAMNSDVTNLQFSQDIPIWENKVYRERPVVTKVDGPITQYRRWFRQFYSEGAGDSFVG